MPTYIVLMKLTEQGIKTIKSGPQRVKDNAKIMEKMGGKMTGFYLTMGEYDYVGIGEAPNDEAALTFLLGMGAAGFVKTTTLKAFTVEEFEKIVKKLP
ncbi:MAG: GYD domain-containing protein [Deltaproteobacteria bacterium]|nr:GYD domain-containing protein [Deltaproteobacteria bacterium]